MPAANRNLLARPRRDYAPEGPAAPSGRSAAKQSRGSTGLGPASAPQDEGEGEERQRQSRQRRRPQPARTIRKQGDDQKGCAGERADPLDRTEIPALQGDGGCERQEDRAPTRPAQAAGPALRCPGEERVKVVPIEAEGKRREAGEAQGDVEGKDDGGHARGLMRANSCVRIHGG